MSQDSHLPEPEAAEAPSSKASEEVIRAVKPGPLTPSRRNKPELPVVGRNSLPRPPRRRTKTSEPETEVPTGVGAAAKSIPPPPLESRLRKETGSLRFDSLINGVPSDHAPGSGASERQRDAFPETSVFAGPIIVEDAPSYREVRSESSVPVSATTSARRKPVPFALIGSGVALLVLAGYAVLKSGVQAGNLSGTSVAVSNEGAARQPGLPVPALTPGKSTSSRTLPSNAAALAASPPAISPQVRGEVLRTYGIPDEAANRQVVIYLIPPSLNGLDSSANVFPTTPWFANLKRRLDRELTQKVAGGEVTLTQAQTELTTNWIDSAHRHYVRNYGENATEKARKIENKLNWISGSENSSKGKKIITDINSPDGTDDPK